MQLTACDVHYRNLIFTTFAWAASGAACGVLHVLGSLISTSVFIGYVVSPAPSQLVYIQRNTLSAGQWVVHGYGFRAVQCGPVDSLTSGGSPHQRAGSELHTRLLFHMLTSLYLSLYLLALWHTAQMLGMVTVVQLSLIPLISWHFPQRLLVCLLLLLQHVFQAGVLFGFVGTQNSTRTLQWRTTAHRSMYMTHGIKGSEKCLKFTHWKQASNKTRWKIGWMYNRVSPPQWQRETVVWLVPGGCPELHAFDWPRPNYSKRLWPPLQAQLLPLRVLALLKGQSSFSSYGNASDWLRLELGGASEIWGGEVGFNAYFLILKIFSSIGNSFGNGRNSIHNIRNSICIF